MSGGIRTLVHAWLLLDFFGDSRRTGQPGSSLTTTIFTQSFIGLVFAVLLFPDYPYENKVAYIAANLSLSTLMVGIGVLGDPHRYHRAHADEILVRTAPLRPGALTLARTLYGSFYISLVTIGMALPAAILSYWVCDHSLWIPAAYLAVAVMCAGIIAGSLNLFTRVMQLLGGPARAQLVAGSMKALLLGGGFVMFVLGLRHLDGVAKDLPLGPYSALAWPPYWCSRLLLDPEWSFAAALAGTILGLYVLGSLINQAGMRQSANRPARAGLLSRLDDRLARGGPLLGLTRFVSIMLYRSPGYRARVLPLFGLPMAMVLLSFWGQDDQRAQRLLLGITLQFPAIFMPFLVAFLPRSDHENAGWTFDTSPTVEPALFRRASFIALCTHVLMPAHLLALVTILAVGQMQELMFVLGLSAFSFGIAVLALTMILQRLDHIPFTMDDEPEGASEALDFGPMLGIGLVLAVIGSCFSLWLSGVGALVCGLAVAGFGVYSLQTRRFA